MPMSLENTLHIIALKPLNSYDNMKYKSLTN